MTRTRFLRLDLVVAAVTLFGTFTWMLEHSEAIAQGQFIFQESFDDKNLFDNDPVTWTISPESQGEINASSGDLVFKVPAETDLTGVPEVVAREILLEDSSTRATVRISGISRGLGIEARARDEGEFLNYTASVNYLPEFGSLFFLGKETATGGADRLGPAAFLPFDVRETPTIVQLDVFGDEITAWAWASCEEMPEDPAFRVFDNSITGVGSPGIIVTDNRANNRNDAELIVQSFAVADVPIHQIPELNGDFNHDGDLGGADINALMNEVGAETNCTTFDLTSDGLVNDDDRDEWLAIAGPLNGFSEAYLLGDADLDGSVDAADLNAVALTWQSSNDNWTNGNFTGGGTNAADLNVMALNWRQSIAAASQVPEPASLVLAVIALTLLCRRRCGLAE